MRIEPEVRWMSIADALHVSEMSKACNRESEGISEKDVVDTLASTYGAGMVAGVKGEEVGFILYETHKTRYHVLDLCVQAKYRRHGIATELMERLITKLKNTNRYQILVETDDSELGTHLFLKSVGFKAIKVMKDHFSEPTQDGYLFQYRNARGLARGKK